MGAINQATGNELTRRPNPKPNLVEEKVVLANGITGYHGGAFSKAHHLRRHEKPVARRRLLGHLSACLVTELAESSGQVAACSYLKAEFQLRRRLD